MKGAKPDLWMPLYVGDYLGDTTNLTTEQHGAYLLLLMTAWMKGGYLPDDDQQLAAIAKADRKAWGRLRVVLSPFFQIDSGRWCQARLMEELVAAQKRVEANRANGKLGGRPAKPKENPTVNPTQSEAKPKENPTVNPSTKREETPSPSPKPNSVSNDTGAAAALVSTDPVFGGGLSFLIGKGCKENQARSVLGKVRKKVGDLKTASLIAAAVREDITEPLAWLMAAADRENKPATRELAL